MFENKILSKNIFQFKTMIKTNAIDKFSSQLKKTTLTTLSKAFCFSSLMLFTTLTAHADYDEALYEKLSEKLAILYEETDYQPDLRHFIIAKGLYKMTKEYSDAETLLDLFVDLSDDDKKRVESSLFKSASEIQELHNYDTTQTSVCWAALTQHNMALANKSCEKAYQLNAMYAPAMVNYAHILFYKGNVKQAKNLVAQSLIGNDRTSDWVNILKDDFETLTNIYNSKNEEMMNAWTKKQSESSWYKEYNVVEEEKENIVDDGEEASQLLVLLKSQQKIVAKRFGDYSLINAYFLTELGKYSVYEKGDFNDVANNHTAYNYYSSAKKIFDKLKVSEDSSLTSDMMLFLNEYKH